MPQPRKTGQLPERRNAEEARSDGGSWVEWFRIGTPLTVAVALLIVFVTLLLQQAKRSDDVEKDLTAQSAEGYSLTPIPADQYPVGSPTEPTPPPLKRYGGEFPRWNIIDLPEGWDPDLAKSIHAYFEAMTVDLNDAGEIDRLKEAREEFADFLANLGPEAVATLATILNAEGDFVARRFILKALGNLGPESEQATFVLRDFFMSRHEDRRNDSEMWHTIDAMGLLKNETSLGILTDFIENPSPSVERHRDHFVEMLGEHPRNVEVVDVFVDHLHGEGELSKSVRNKAAQALGKTRDANTLSELYRAADQETYWVVKQTILGSIGKIGDPSSVPFLREQYQKNLYEVQGTQDPMKLREPARIRQSAAMALYRLQSEEATQTLRELAATEPDSKTQKLIEGLLKQEEPTQSQ